MLNYIWGIFIIVGIMASAFNGRLPEAANAILEGGKSAVSLAITMLGIISIWTGVMRIAERGGMIESLSRKSARLINNLFPDIPENHPARSYIATNFAANILGLGWAATPAGLLAMEELNKLNKGRERASRSMCMFLIINMSSLQLVTVNIIAYRSEYGSANPTEIVFAGIIATLVSTLTAVASAKIFERWYR